MTTTSDQTRPKTNWSAWAESMAPVAATWVLALCAAIIVFEMLGLFT